MISSANPADPEPGNPAPGGLRPRGIAAQKSPDRRPVLVKLVGGDVSEEMDHQRIEPVVRRIAYRADRFRDGASKAVGDRHVHADDRRGTGSRSPVFRNFPDHACRLFEGPPPPFPVMDPGVPVDGEIDGVRADGEEFLRPVVIEQQVVRGEGNRRPAAFHVAEDRQEIVSHEGLRSADVYGRMVAGDPVHEIEHFPAREFPVPVSVADAPRSVVPAHPAVQVAAVAQLHVEKDRVPRREKEIQAGCAACRFPEAPAPGQAFADHLPDKRGVALRRFRTAGDRGILP